MYNTKRKTALWESNAFHDIPEEFRQLSVIRVLRTKSELQGKSGRASDNETKNVTRALYWLMEQRNLFDLESMIAERLTSFRQFLVDNKLSYSTISNYFKGLKKFFKC